MSEQDLRVDRIQRLGGDRRRPVGPRYPAGPPRPIIPLRPAESPAPTDLPRPVRGVLLDMCGVLYDNTVWRRWLLRLLTKLGLHTSYHAFFRVLDRDFLAEVHCGKRRFDEAFRAFLRSAGLSRGQIDEVEAACQARRRQWEAGARTLPGVKNTLGRLAKSGFALGGIIIQLQKLIVTAFLDCDQIGNRNLGLDFFKSFSNPKVVLNLRSHSGSTLHASFTTTKTGLPYKGEPAFV